MKTVLCFMTDASLDNPGPKRGVIDPATLRSDEQNRKIEEHKMLSIASGRGPNGSWDKWTPEAVRQMHVENKRKQRLANQEGYQAAIADVMPAVAEIKGMLLGLADEAPELPDGTRDLSQVKTDRLSLLLKVVESFENRWLGKAKTVNEQTGSVSMIHELQAVQRSIEKGKSA